MRRLTLRHERQKADRDEVMYALLFVAENTAKVVFNASGSGAPFDPDSGWWLPANAESMISKVPSLRTDFETAIFGA